MAMNLARTGSAAVVGVVSGGLEAKTTPVDLGDTKISWGTIAEAAAVVVGGGMQLMAPYMAPNIVDGLVDGGIALLASRGAQYALAQMAPPAAAMFASPMHMGALAGGNGAAANAYARPMGNVSRLSRATLT